MKKAYFDGDGKDEGGEGGKKAAQVGENPEGRL